MRDGRWRVFELYRGFWRARYEGCVFSTVCVMQI